MSVAGAQKATLRMDLERSRAKIIDAQHQIKLIGERLALLPRLEGTQKRYQQARLEDRLKEKSQLVREERILTMMRKRLNEAGIYVWPK
jgi:hypothetical protein